MPRRIPPDRFQEMIAAATGVFIAQGYRRTQMVDVAQAMGVAKGTVYLYVESKEALFDAVVRYADQPADETHHYGHAKAESMAALIETGLLFTTTAWIVSMPGAGPRRLPR